MGSSKSCKNAPSLSSFPTHRVSQPSSPSPDFEKLFLDAYESYADAIFRHCTLRTGDRDLGKDLMQDTFLKTWDFLRKGSAVENMRAFLYKIANNLITDHYRRKKRREELSLETLQEEGFDIPDKAPTPSRIFEGQFVLDTVTKIEEPYRTAVIMRFVDDLPPRDIAELLGVSANVASVRIHRGLQRLEMLLKGKHG